MFPLWSKFGTLFFAAIGIWMFAISRDPRDWRRWMQDTFHKNKTISVNANKRLDEKMKKISVHLLSVCILIAVGFLVAGSISRRIAQEDSGSEDYQDKTNRKNVERLRELYQKSTMEERVKEAAKRPQER